MSSSIFGRRFSERNGQAWWGGDKRLEGLDGKATTALIAADADYPVLTVPLSYSFGGATIVTDHVAIVRPPMPGTNETEPVQLGIATNEYTPITNYDLCAMIDPLTDKWPTETLGALGRGEDFFVTLNAGRTEIGGDEMANYYFVWNKHDGTGALRVMFTPRRVVCKNTCILGAKEAIITANVIHTKRVHEEAKFAMSMVEQLREVRERSLRQLGRFPNVVLTPETIKRCVETIYPIKPRAVDVELLEEYDAGKIELSDQAIGKMRGVVLSNIEQERRARKLRVGAYECLDRFNDERSKYAKTAWAVYNAVTETESWRTGGNDASLMKSLMTGERAANIRAAYDILSAEVAK